MAVFTYTAISGDGRQSSGTVPADSRAAAMAAVVGKGLTPVSLEEQGGGKAAAAVESDAAHAGRVTQKQVENFTREMANLLAGGVPLARSLQLLRRESSEPAARHLLGKIHDDVVGGVALGDALAAHPKAFSQVYVAMVRAGEAGGFLDVVLMQIAEFRAREQDLKGKVKAALVYPCILAVMAVAVLAFLMTYFIPQFAVIFKNAKSALPPLTQVVMAVSGFVKSYGLVLLVALVIGILSLRRAVQTDGGRRRMERIILSTPGLGKVVAHFALVRFSRMLGTLLGAGVPLVMALKVARAAIGNQTLSDTVAHGIEEVQRGASLARALAEAKQLFPASVIEMIAIAEETGRLDKELVRLSVTYEAELDRRLRMLVAMVEPIMLLIMAAFIGTIVLAMLLPVFNMQELANK